MSKNLDKIIDEVDQEIKKGKTKVKKAPKTIKVSTLIKISAYTVALLAIGAFAGITINNSINSTIETQVNQKVEQALKIEE